jgi:hypothetical protein
MTMDSWDSGLTNFLHDIIAPAGSTDGQMTTPCSNQAHPSNFDSLNFASTNPFVASTGDFDQQDSVDARHGVTREPLNSGQATPQKRGSTIPSHNGISSGIIAFKDSLWQYAPTQGNHRGEDQIGMSLPLDELIDQSYYAGCEKLCPDIRPPTRDRILTTVVEQCDTTVVRSVIASFPSTEILTISLHQFVLHHREEKDTWIHIPSFDPNQQLPEIFVCMIAAGAMCSPDPAVRRAGHAFQEATRIAILKVFEDDNRTSRYLKPLQIFTLVLDLGLWSGDRRNI